MAKLKIDKAALLSKLKVYFTKKLKEEVNFFKNPMSLDAIRDLTLAGILALLDKYIRTGSNDEKEIENYINSTPLTRSIKSTATSSFEDDFVSNLLIQCSSDLAIPQINDDTLIANSKDFDTSTDKPIKLKGKQGKDLTDYLSYVMLLKYIIFLIRNLLKDTDHPSRYRTKYIQKLIRISVATLKSAYKNTSNGISSNINSLYSKEKIDLSKAGDSISREFGNLTDRLKSLIAPFKELDNLLVILAASSYLYLKNRKKLQDDSFAVMKANLENQSCISFPDTSDPLVIIKQLTNTVSCDFRDDGVIVPKTPIEEKYINLCEVVVEKDQEVADITEYTELADRALLSNKSTDLLSISITPKTVISNDTVLGTYKGRSVYSPVTGVVEKIKGQSIFISGISDNVNNIDEQVTSLNNKYKDLNDVKDFIKKYLILILYPSMLVNSKTLASKFRLRPYYDAVIKQKSNIDKDYETKIKDLSSQSNIQKHADNETLNEFKDSFDKEESAYYNNIINLFNTSKLNSKTLISDVSEESLIEYYLYDVMPNLTSDNLSVYEQTLKDKITTFINKRYVLDSYSKGKIAANINSYLKVLQSIPEKLLFFVTKNYIDIDSLMSSYNIGKNIDIIKKTLRTLASNNKKLSDEDKLKIVNKILWLFEFYLNADNIAQKIKSSVISKKNELSTETSWINDFTNGIILSKNSILDDITNIQNKIDDLSIFNIYRVDEIDDELTRVYEISSSNCAQPLEIDENLTAKTAVNQNNIKYWLKYCALATGAGVINPITGWSTGLITPLGPLKFPVVYIPIKPVVTKYGIIVLGLSICGIYLTPFVLLVNHSIDAVMPFVDPFKFVKTQIEQVKTEIKNNLKDLRKGALKGYMDKTKTDIEIKVNELFVAKNQLNNLKKNKPIKPEYKSKDNIDDERFSVKEKTKVADNIARAKHNVEYEMSLIQWNIDQIKLTEQNKVIRYELWALQKKWKLINDYYEDNSVDKKGVDKNIDAIQTKIDDKFSFLNSQMTKLNKLYESSPLSLKAESVNFGMTLKNPEPIIRIDSDILSSTYGNNIDNVLLEKIMGTVKLNNEILMSDQYDNLKSNTILNTEKYKKLLSLSMNSLIVKDQFPKYENLKLNNVPFMTFLIKDFVTVGAQTFGIPGMLPLPIG
jgi:hypothetical protein